MMKATLTQIRTETHDTKTLVFDTVGIFDFIPGQFVMLEVQLRNEDEFTIRDGKSTLQKRAFSIASAPGNGFELCVKDEPNGFVSTFLTTVVKIGDEFNFTGPFGKFTFEMCDHAVLIAAGSGIAPMRSILLAYPDMKIDLFYSNKTTEDVAYHKELLGISAVHAGINIHCTITRQDECKQPWEGMTGRLNGDVIATSLGSVAGKKYWICGPVAFAKSIRTSLIEKGVAEADVKIEAWG